MKSMGGIIWLGVIGAAAYVTYEWLLTQCASASASSGIFPTICPLMPGYVAPAAGSASGSTGSTATQVLAQISNATRPGMAFQVGDTFHLQITGPPNTPVTISATQNGTSLGTTPFGSTDANGILQLTGTYTASNIGTWAETIKAGSWTPATLNLTISGLSGLSGNLIPSGMIHRGGF